MTVVALKRPVTLGGSSAAAAAGIDPYRSRVMLWCELTGRVERLPSEAMRWGNLLEGVIADELTERGYYTSRWAAELSDDDRPWLVGHPDGVVDLGDGGEDALLEIKTAGPFAGKWGDTPPVAYVAQCQIYMHLTGLRRALLACLVGGQKLELRTVDYDDRATGLLLARMDEFYGYVLRDEPPPPDGSDSARDALAAMFPGATERVYRLTADEWKIATELRALKEQGKALDAQIAERENLLKAAMGDADTAISPHDTPAVHWRNVSSTRLDGARLKAERPDVAEQFQSTTETRRFTLA